MRIIATINIEMRSDRIGLLVGANFSTIYHGFLVATGFVGNIQSYPLLRLQYFLAYIMSLIA